MAKTDILTSLEVAGQIPLDSKLYILNLSTLADLGTDAIKAFKYFEGMKVYVNENKLEYIWREVITGDAGGVVTDNYIYPNDVVANGVVYSNRVFNFFINTTDVSSVTKFQEEVSKNEDITSNKGRITTNEGDIATNEGNITTNEGNITSNKGRIVVNEGKIQTIEAGTTNVDNTSDVDKPVSTAQQAGFDSDRGRLVNLENNQVDGVIRYDTLAELQAITTPSETASYKVTNDGNNNGNYFYDGSGFELEEYQPILQEDTTDEVTEGSTKLVESGGVHAFVGEAVKESKTYTDNEIAELNLRIIQNQSGEILFIDKDENIAFKIDVDGKVFVGDFESKYLKLYESFVEDNKTTDVFNYQDAKGNYAIRLTKDFILKLKGLEFPDGSKLLTANGSNVKKEWASGQPTDIVHIISYGQSNSKGEGIWNVLTPSAVYDTVMPNTGRSTVETVDFTFAPYYEPNSECPLSGMNEAIIERVSVDNLTRIEEKDFQIFVTTPGYGDTSITDLDKGSTYYNRLLWGVTKGKELAEREGKTFSVGAIGWTQGEKDMAMTISERESYLTNLITDLNDDIYAITGQKNTVPFISYQLSWRSPKVDSISQVQFQQAISNNLYTVACPTYFMEFDTQLNGSSQPVLIHFTAKYRRILGYYYGIAAKKWAVDGVKFKPLHINSYVVNGNDISLYYNLDSDKLEVDITEVTNPEFYGFELYNGETKIALSNLVVEGNKITITAASSPLGLELRYAYNAKYNEFEFYNETTDIGRLATRGNIRDNQGDYIQNYGHKFNNWAISQIITL